MSDSKMLLCFLICFVIDTKGLFGVDGDEVKSVSVTEGESVTLHTDLTHIQRQDQILWMFGPQEKRIAEIYKGNIDMFDSSKTFGDRLKMNGQTGSLTITNITITDSGLYKLQIIRDNGTLYKRFDVTVFARLSVPVIARISNSSQCSSSSERSSASTCVLLCSVMNVTRVSLSWYNGSRVHSSISVSDLNIRLSLPLEVEYQDTNTYRCVVNNPITNLTQHLDIKDVCRPCSVSVEPYSRWKRVTPSMVYALMGVTAVALLVYYVRSKQEPKKNTGLIHTFFLRYL